MLPHPLHYQYSLHKIQQHITDLATYDLKLGKFKASYKGQMELYLRWLEKNEMQEGEETPLGLILCAAGNDEQVELLQLHKAGSLTMLLCTRATA